jgi:hypothetical protein
MGTLEKEVVHKELFSTWVSGYRLVYCKGGGALEGSLGILMDFHI